MFYYIEQQWILLLHFPAELVKAEFESLDQLILI